MSVGIVMLIHTAFDRAEQVVRHWHRGGCPVVIHVDRNVPRAVHDRFRHILSDLDRVRFAPRHRCEWGTWGIVGATLSASELMLRSFPEASHVYLASGSCLPLRPVRELQDYLAARPGTDFIESATVSEVPWTVGGLDDERFTLRFPFAWKRQRRLFDAWVEIQRALRLRRRMPAGLAPHIGSQWWCLTRATLEALLTDPDRPVYDRFFRRVWIPDESYFQTLARLYARRIESRSLTLSKFDFQGKPHIFYDDHLQLLRRSDCFVARKIWPRAERLYDVFLDPAERAMQGTEPNPGKIDRIFSKAVERRTRGRAGLYMQSRLPNPGWENGVTSARFGVFEGFAELFEGFEDWLARATDGRVHGHLFAPGGAEFEARQSTFSGALPAHPTIRDYNAQMWLRSLIWNTRGERQCFQFGPHDVQFVSEDIARDPNAHVSVIAGAWAVPLFRSGRSLAELRIEAAALQKTESRHIRHLRATGAKARVRIWSLAEFVEAPAEALREAVADLTPARRGAPRDLPRMVDLAGFGRFLQSLRNEGMHPWLMGDFPVEPPARRAEPAPRKRYLVR